VIPRFARHSLTGVLALSTGACLGNRPQIMTPVRVDSAQVVMLPAVQLVAPSRVTGETDLFERLDRMAWPGPNDQRSAFGAPGPGYWQQSADYTIDATLDTAQATVSGTVTIRYTNNSPDSLRFVWLQLDQNLYRPFSKGSRLFTAESRWGVRGFEGGFEISNLRIDGRGAVGRVDDTMMRIELENPIASRGGKASISMSYRFRVPEHGSDRMGRDSTLYEIAQWYPRMAVYDDVRGWNTDPYLGQGEFYLEYGDFDYSVTVPAGYVVAGSGILVNREQMLTSAQRERLDRATRSASVVQIITDEEARAAKARAVPGMRTWQFRATRVRDVAWAAAPDFRWDATSWNGVLTQAYYQFPKAGKAWEHAAEQTQWSIRTYSELWFPYPYPQATSVAGPVGGMEYPMFVMVHYGTADPMSIFGTIDHEQGHQWFPMIVGSNERRYAWQDEGIDTYSNAFSNERRTPTTSVYSGYLANWQAAVEQGTQSPMMTAPDRINPAALGAIGYRKPAAVLLALRDNVVSREALDRAIREYTRRWAFKHPTPADFFRTVENVTGEDLSWFWRAFFYSTDVLDFGIEAVNAREVGGQRVAEIMVRRHTSVPFPILVRLRMSDGTMLDVRAPVQVWHGTDRYTLSVPINNPVVGARLWPDPNVPDWNKGNDIWGSPPPADAIPSTGGGLASPIAAPGLTIPR
jgi:hypothetical protein